MPSKFTLLLLLIAVGWFYTSCKTTVTADMIIYGGPIYTMTEEGKMVEAIAVKGDTIFQVGTLTALQEFQTTSTNMYDLQGKTLTPGLIESHAHFFDLGTNKLDLDLSDTRSYEEIVSIVKEAVDKTAPGQWIFGRGWHQSKWDSLPELMVGGFQTHQALSSISPDNPIYLRHASGHAGFANQKAMELAGILSKENEGLSNEIEGGEIVRDFLGNPTGIFNETAMGLITRVIPKDSPERIHKALELATEECLSHGITSFHDAREGQNIVNTLLKFGEKDSLKVRLYIMLNAYDPSLLEDWYKKGPQIGLYNNHLTIRAIKIFSDGALGSRGAWLLEDYTDQPGHMGHTLTPLSEIKQIVLDGVQNGFQVCTHAIGDRANREVLNIYEEAFRQYPEQSEDARFRIEHAQHISEEDIPRFAELGVIPSMQAIHLSSDRPWAIDRLGKKRIEEGAYVWRKLLDSGAKVINGTDAPVEPIDPIACFYASVTRKTLDGKPEGGYEPSQKMTRYEALKSYTLDAAYGAFEENIKGSIEKGKLADFTIFSQDLMLIPEEEILNTKIEATIVGGEFLYERK